jgi:hypothetical protein
MNSAAWFEIKLLVVMRMLRRAAKRGRRWFRWPPV